MLNCWKHRSNDIERFLPSRIFSNHRFKALRSVKVSNAVGLRGGRGLQEHTIPTSYPYSILEIWHSNLCFDSLQEGRTISSYNSLHSFWKIFLYWASIYLSIEDMPFLENKPNLSRAWQLFNLMGFSCGHLKLLQIHVV